jgi:hypothetical protein
MVNFIHPEDYFFGDPNATEKIGNEQGIFPSFFSAPSFLRGFFDDFFQRWNLQPDIFFRQN